MLKSETPRGMRGVGFLGIWETVKIAGGRDHQAGMTAPVYLSSMYFFTSGEW